MAFARTHQPDCDGLPRWPVYDLETRQTLIFDTSCRIEADPRGDERRLFGTVAYVQPGT
jgi:para-nitrobenzyl esterase